MTYVYELWDNETRNLLGTYPSEETALAVIRSLLQKHGPGAVASLFLGREDEAGRSTLIADGNALVKRAEATETVGQRNVAATSIGHDTSTN